MKETVHIQPVIKQMEPAMGWLSTLILLEYTPLLHLISGRCFISMLKVFVFLFCLAVTATGFTLSKIFSLSTCGAASGCCVQFWASSCKTDVDKPRKPSAEDAMMVGTCSRRRGWTDRAALHGEGAAPGSPNCSPHQCTQGGLKELAGEQSEAVNWMRTPSDFWKEKDFPMSAARQWRRLLREAPLGVFKTHQIQPWAVCLSMSWSYLGQKVGLDTCQSPFLWLCVSESALQI